MNIESDPPFAWTDRVEPHVPRRKLLILRHPEIRKLFGYDSRQSYAIIFLVLLQLALAASMKGVQAHAGWLPVAILAYVIGAVLNHALAMGVHEASHHLVASTPVRNRWMAIFADIPVVLPGAMSFWRYHADHHRYLGIERRDNDLPSRFEVRWLGNSALAKSLWLFFYFFFAVFGRGFLNRPNRWEMINFLVVGVTTNLLLWFFLGPVSVVYLLLSTFFGFGLHPVAGHFIHEHYSFTTDGQETYSYYGLLNKIAFNVGFHNEHHDFFTIPGSRLPELHAIARDTYGTLASHRSWTKVLLEFIFRKDLGHFSRIVRD